MMKDIITILYVLQFFIECISHFVIVGIFHYNLACLIVWIMTFMIKYLLFVLSKSEVLIEPLYLSMLVQYFPFVSIITIILLSLLGAQTYDLVVMLQKQVERLVNLFEDYMIDEITLVINWCVEKKIILSILLYIIVTFTMNLYFL